MTDANRPLVVLCGRIHPDGQALLEREARVVLTEDLSEANVVALAKDAEGILFRGKPLCSQGLMTACPKLRVVGRHGAGLDIVDIPAATRLGVAVVHAPGSNSQAVAEHALMLMLMCAKRAVEVDKGTRAGNWFARDDAANTELGGKTLGIVGIGNVGRRVAKFTGALGCGAGSAPVACPSARAVGRVAGCLALRQGRVGAGPPVVRLARRFPVL